MVEEGQRGWSVGLRGRLGHGAAHRLRGQVAHGLGALTKPAILGPLK